MTFQTCDSLAIKFASRITTILTSEYDLCLDNQLKNYGLGMRLNHHHHPPPPLKKKEEERMIRISAPLFFTSLVCSLFRCTCSTFSFGILGESMEPPLQRRGLLHQAPLHLLVLRSTGPNIIGVTSSWIDAFITILMLMLLELLF